MSATNLENTLIKWIKSTNIDDQLTLEMLNDGNALYQMLKQIDINYFTTMLIGTNLCEENYLLKNTNLSILLKDLLCYYSQVLNLKPNNQCVPKITNNPITHEVIFKIIQLILGCAVNCENKQVYIEQIIQMDQADQEAIMKAITQLDLKEYSPVAYASQLTHTPKKELLDSQHEFDNSKVEKEELEAKCQEYLNKITLMEHEKIELQAENQKLMREMASNKLHTFTNAGKSSHGIEGEDDQTTDRNMSDVNTADLKKQIDTLRHEIYALENARDDCQIQIQLLKKECQELKRKNEELNGLAAESSKYKDELDVLRHMAEKIPMYESTIDSYKKKLETLSFTQSNDLLSEKIAEVGQATTLLDEEKRKSTALKSELDNVTLKHRQLQHEYEGEREKYEKVMVQNIELQETLAKHSTKNQNLVAENKNLKDENDYLNLCLFKAKESQTTDANLEPNLHVNVAVNPIKDVQPPKVQEISITDILEVGHNAADSKQASIEEYIAKERMYLRCLGKAKLAIDMLEAKLNEALPHEEMLKKLKEENDHLKNSQEIIATAWNNLSLRMYKQNMKERFTSNLYSEHSFLNRQRQIMASKTLPKKEK